MGVWSSMIRSNACSLTPQQHPRQGADSVHALEVSLYSRRPRVYGTSPMADHVLAIDQGTTGSTALIISTDGTIVGRSTLEFKQHFPEPGWVEHDTDEIWESVLTSIAEALERSGLSVKDIACIGITNQRETTVVWDRKTGKSHTQRDRLAGSTHRRAL